MILSRTRPSLFLPAIMFLWGTSAALMAAVTKPSHLIGLRFLLGIFEAGFSVSWFSWPPRSTPVLTFASRQSYLSSQFGTGNTNSEF